MLLSPFPLPDLLLLDDFDLDLLLEDLLCFDVDVLLDDFVLDDFFVFDLKGLCQSFGYNQLLFYARAVE